MTTDDFGFPSQRLRKLRERLRRWYSDVGRELPWRTTGDPYAIWVSEIMLQQTTVQAVIPYYHRFLEAFPSVHDLADADEGEVLRLWEGLGYYSRARNLKKAARRIVDDFEGVFPSDPETLQSLPGIGRYTAGAIASFAFDKSAPIVEANTVRLYARLTADDGDLKSTAGQKRLWAFAERIVPRKEPGLFNQALMELGSQVCTPTAPDCETCPVAPCCHTFEQGRQEEIPRPTKRQKITDVTEMTVVIRRAANDNADQYLLRQRTDAERWSGMWDFPRFAITERFAPKTVIRPGEESPIDTALGTHIVQEIERISGVSIEPLRFLTELKHGVTRYRIRLLCVLATFVEGEPRTDTAHEWVSPANFEAYPLPVTGRKLAALVATPPPTQRSLFREDAT